MLSLRDARFIMFGGEIMLALAMTVWIILNGKVNAEILLIGIPIVFFGWVFAKSHLGWNIKKELCLYRLLPMIVKYLIVLVAEIIKSSVFFTFRADKMTHPKSFIPNCPKCAFVFRKFRYQSAA